MREGDWKLYAKARENVRPAGIPEMNNADKKHFLVHLAKDPGEGAQLGGRSPRRTQAPSGTGQAISGRLGEEVQVNPLVRFSIP